MGQPLKKPVVFGDYLLVERVNVGGMAEVFKAKSYGVEGFEKLVAVKRILPNIADDREFINMFVDEARIAAQLSHPNIIQIHELGKFDGQYFIAMEYVAGKDLRQLADFMRRREELFSIEAAAFISAKVCEALDYAHKKTDAQGNPLNVIHRDVSPQNVLLSFEGSVKLTDFGVAKADNRASQTQAGVLKGKFGYMAPEQVRGADLTHRADIFSAGILLYELLSGQKLFEGESDFSTLEKVRLAEVPPLNEYRADVPEELEAVVRKALAPDPDERFAWASEMADALAPFTLEEGKPFGPRELASLVSGHFEEELEIESERDKAYAALSTPTGMSRNRPRPPMQVEVTKGDGDNEGGDSTQVYDPQVEAAQRALQSSQSPRGGASGSKQKLPLVLGLLIGLVALSALGLQVVQERGYLFPPSATLSVDVAAKGATLIFRGEEHDAAEPISFDGLGEGRYILKASAPGFVPLEWEVGLEPGMERSLRLHLRPEEPVNLELSSNPPGAQVFLFDKPQGKTPVTLKVPYPGDPIPVRLVLPCHKEVELGVEYSESDLLVREKRVTANLAKLGKTDGTLVVDVQPKDAEVRVGEEGVRIPGPFPYRLSGLDPYAKYQLVTKSKGKTERRQVDMQCKEERSVLIDLGDTEPSPQEDKTKQSGNGKSGGKGAQSSKKCGAGRPAKMSMVVQGGSGCTVTVGGQALDASPPFLNVAVPSGLCQVKVECEDRHYRGNRRIPADGQVKVVITPDMWKKK